MRKISFFALIYIWVGLFGTAAAYGDGNTKEILTPDERRWLTQNQPRIVYAVETNYPPFVFIGSNNQPTGLAYDYIRLVESKLGVRFNEKRFSSLETIFSKVRSKEVNIVNAVTVTPKRSSFLLFTDSFVSVPNVIIVNKKRQDPIKEKDLSGLRVSLVKSYAVTEYLMKNNLVSSADLVSNDLSALLNVSFGSSDAAVVDLATASYLISKNGITNLRVAGKTNFNIQLSMAASAEEPLLRTILQKGVAAITDEEREEIHKRWINASTQSIFSNWKFWAVLGGILLITLLTAISNRTLRYQVNLRTKAEQKLQILNDELTKHAHELIEISESLNKAQELAHLGNWVWDLQTNALWWSDEIYRIFGLKPQEFAANYKDFLLLVHPDDRDIVEKAVNHTLTHHTDYKVIHRLIKMDGTQRHVLEEGYLEYVDGKPAKMHGTVQDITEQKAAQEALEESEQKYRDLVEHAMVGIYRSDLSGKILYVNQTFINILGYDSPDELIGQKSVMVYNDPKEREKLIEKLSADRFISNYELELIDRHSDILPVLVSATLDGDTLSGMIINMREIKKSRIEIETLSKVIEQIDDLVTITDKRGIITYVNQAFCDQTGYTRGEVIGESVKLLKSDHYDNEYYKKLWTTILCGEVFRETIINRKKNGDLYYENKTISPLKDDNNNIISFVSTGKDVTSETLMNQEIQRIATIDKLTGIYNRHKFEELFALESERSRRFSQPLSLILIDIDHFKLVNDTYGHDVGDEVLKTLTDIVQENIRKIDIFARWGGEEFLLLSPCTDLENIQKLAEKLRFAIESTPFPEVNHVTISLGATTFREEDSFKELFKRADEGLYHAKGHGRNQVGVI